MSAKPARKASNPHLGSDFDDLLREEGLYNEAQAIAAKRALAYALERGMAKAQLTKRQWPSAWATTRAQLDRFLNPDNPATTLQTLVRAAGATGKRVKISLANS
jgi:antitoxin HicB